LILNNNIKKKIEAIIN